MPPSRSCRSATTRVNYLYQCLASGDPATTAVLGRGLRPHNNGWPISSGKIAAARADDRRILPAASLLADYDPANPAWNEVGDRLAPNMVKVKLDDVKGWRKAAGECARLTRGVRWPRSIATRAGPELEHTIATTLLARYVADQGGFVVDLLLGRESQLIYDPLSRDPGQQKSSSPWPLRGRNSRRWPISPLTAMDERTAAREPRERDQFQDERSARRARAAVALLRLGDADAVWPLLEHAPDPSTRSHLISEFHTHNVPPATFVRGTRAAWPHGKWWKSPKRVRSAPTDGYLFEPVISRKTQLILALASYPRADLSRGRPGQDDGNDRRAVPERSGCGRPFRGRAAPASVGSLDCDPDRSRPCAQPGRPIGKRWSVNSGRADHGLDCGADRVPDGLASRRRRA